MHKFQFTQPSFCNYLYRGDVENHNCMCPEGKINRSLDCRMYGLTTGGKQESLNRDKFVFMSQVFSKEGRRIQAFNFEIVL